MLLTLDIRDMLLIERLDMSFRPGLNVLTGETGAGKSILLDCLGFVLGWKGRADLVRPGAAQGEVTAVFAISSGHPAATVLAEAGLPEAGEELLLRRTIGADGRRSGFVNDRRAGAEVLRALAETLVELHGQHDDTGLLNPRLHRRLLDAFAGAGETVAKVCAAWEARARADKASAEAREAVEKSRSDEDFLRHAVGELDKLRPQPGEDSALDARRRLMQGAARIREDVARAAEALGGDGAEGRMADASRWLGGVVGRAEGLLDAPSAALERAMTELGEATQGIERALEAMRFDPHELEAAEERLFAIRALARKHAVAPDDLGALAETMRARLLAAEGGIEGLRELDAARKAAETAYDAAAARLSAERRKAADALDRAMAAELPPLKLDRAVFATVVAEGVAGPEGRDTVSFLVAPNPGLPPGPIERIASGGELSRFLLALKVCLARGAEGVTMIFDEIDRGVGGATADAVGRRLARLAEGAQVLVVTHSPQVAARGAHHWHVEKRVATTGTTSVVTALGDGERVGEIARMLAGDRVTDAAREAARALLKG
ncbi:MAG: DNA repair protein RecN [Paracoccaceae bacterium]